MNSPDAKRILLVYRPGGADAHDPQVSEALAQAQRDPALHRWLEKHSAFQASVRRALRHVPVPADLRSRISARAKILVPTVAWRRPALLAVAACLALLLIVSGLWWKPSREDSFATFRSRMVGAVLRQYRMDIVTNDATAIRRFLATNSAPADYVLPPGLARLPASGAGLLSWQDARVSMVCLESPEQGTLFLFVVDRAAVKRPPPPTPEYAPVNKLTTASWTQGDRTYVLAGTGDEAALRRNL